jgi:nuclear pore complex protein Nup155
MTDNTQMFNQYADVASYYDICLQIFYIADYRNPADVRATWQHLLQTLHDEAVARGSAGPQPYEAVIDKLRSLGARLRMSDAVFPIPILLPMLERYALEHQRNVGPPTWVIDTFFDLGVPHETIYSVLESMYYIDEAPFHGSNRKIIARDLLYTIEHWFHDTVRLGGVVFGSDLIAERVEEMLTLLQQGGISAEQMAAAHELRARINNILR